MIKNSHTQHVAPQKSLVLPKIAKNTSKQLKQNHTHSSDKYSEKASQGIISSRLMTDRKLQINQNFANYKLQKIAQLKKVLEEKSAKQVEQTLSSKHKNKAKQIKLKKINCIEEECTTLSNLTRINESEDDKGQLKKLEEWSNSLENSNKKAVQLLGHTKKKRRISESIAYLYKNENKYIHRTISHEHFQYSNEKYKEIMSFLSSIDGYINKLHKINYQAIYKNVQYTQGVYEGEVNIIFKKIKLYREYLRNKIDEMHKAIKRKRQEHNTLIIELNKSRTNIHHAQNISARTSHDSFSKNKIKILSSESEQKIGASKKSQNKCGHEDQKMIQYLKSVSSPLSPRKNEAFSVNFQNNMMIQTNKKDIPVIEEEAIRPSIDSDKCSMEESSKTHQSINTQSYKNLRNTNILKRISRISEQIQEQEQQLKPLKDLEKQIIAAKTKVLKILLKTGYDTREDGLVWILRQLQEQIGLNNRQSFEEDENQGETSENDGQNSDKIKELEVKPSQLPEYLTNQEIYFIFSKFKNDFKRKALQTQEQTVQNQTDDLNKKAGRSQTDNKSEKVEFQQIEEAYRNINRLKNRKLSIIQEKKLLEKMLDEKKHKKSQKHKYLTKNIIELMEGTQKIKATKYQIIYQQTLKKLNRFCSQQIYGTQKIGSSNKIVENYQFQQKIIEDLKNMINSACQKREEEKSIKSEEQKQLSEILKNLRNERYLGSYSQLRSNKNPPPKQERNQIRVLCCLVGAKKAIQILEDEMNVDMGPTA